MAYRSVPWDVKGDGISTDGKNWGVFCPLPDCGEFVVVEVDENMMARFQCPGCKFLWGIQITREEPEGE